MQFKITATNCDDLVKLSGSLDIYAAGELRDALARHIHQHSSLTLDLSAVSACDVVALQLLCSAGKSATLAGKGFSLTAISAAVEQSCAALGIVPERLCASRFD